MTFSQRMRLVPVREAIQVSSLDNETRAALWNLMLPFIWAIQNEYPPTIARSIWIGLYKKPADTVPNEMRTSVYEEASDEILYCRFFRYKIMDGKWNDCLDFIEYIADEKRRAGWNRSFYDYGTRSQKVSVPSGKDFNNVFQQYLVGYRFVNGEITPITNETEIASVETAISNSQPSVQELFSKALRHLSNRSKPDYAKSVECSISAVESQCCIILGDDKVTLGNALKQIENRGIRLHGALKEALFKLYGFTSNDAGIRHGTIQPSDVDQDLAKFMLIVCSAFVNYLITKGSF